MPPLFYRARGLAARVLPERRWSCAASILAGLLLVEAAAGLAGCASSRSATLAHYRDYALAVGQPYPAEASVAQTRVDRYLARLTPARRQALAPYQYIAVQATTIPGAEVASVMKRLVNTGQVSSAMARDTFNISAQSAQFIMIFDVKTGRPATDEGYVAFDTPGKGRPGMFGGYDALYIGTGK